MLEGKIWKQLLFYFFPILVGIFFQQLYNTVDTIIVGRYVGKEALSNVGGSSAQIINLVVGFFTGISTGASVLISRYFGAKDNVRLQESLQTAYAFSVFGGILLGILGVIFSPAILRMMNTPEELMAESVKYVSIYFAGLVFVFVYNMGAAALRAVGDTKRPLYLLMLCCMINVVLDLAFVLIFHAGVAGVAVATMIAQAVSAVAVTWLIAYKTEELTIDRKQIRIKKEMLSQQLWIGLPTGVESSMYSISNMIIQAALNGFGVDTVAAWAVYGKVDGFFWMITSAFGIAIMTFTGQNYGAGKYDRIKKGVRIWLLISVCAAVAISIFLIFTGEFLFGIFTTDAVVVEIGLRMMYVITPAYFLFEFIEILSGVLRAEGFVMVSTLMVLCGTCLFRIIWVMFIAAEKSMEFMILCYPVTWAVCAVSFVVYYWWKQKKLF